MARLNWHASDLDCYGSTGAQLVSFAGGLQVCVFNLTKQHKPCDYWRVSISGEEPPFKALRKRFRSRKDAKAAVEEIMIPFQRLAPRMVRAKAILET